MKSETEITAQFLTTSRVVQQMLQKQSEYFANMVFEAMQTFLSEATEFSRADIIAQVLLLAERGVMNEVVESLGQDDPTFAEEVKKRLFQIEHIVLLDDRAVQKMLREIDSTDLAKALKGVSSEAQDKIFKNMSQRAAALLKEEMEYMGPVRVEDCEGAQQLISRIILALQAKGEITLVSNFGKTDLIT